MADRNCTGGEEIIEILSAGGETVTLPERTRGKKKRVVPKEEVKREEVKREPEVVIPDAVAFALFGRIEELDGLIKPLEEQLGPLKREYEEIADFIKNSGNMEENKHVQI